MITTIQIDKSVKDKMESLKIHLRETYNELILRLINGSFPGNASRESLIATIEVMSDPDAMRDIAESISEINQGNLGTPLEDVKKELGIK